VEICIQSTSKVVTFMVDGHPVPARIWEGTTITGIPVHCFITRIAPSIPKDDPRQREFQEQLKEQAAPTAAIEAYPLRMIL
jgi:hypothetical protein